MVTVQLTGSEWFGKKIAVHKSSQNIDVSSALEFQKHLYNTSRRHGILDNGIRRV